MGLYTGRISRARRFPLAGAAGDEVEMILNLKTAKALGLDIPNTLIGRADEVIE